MKRFNFPLEKLLDLRSIYLKEKENELASVMSKYNLELAKLNKLKQDRRRTIEAIKSGNISVRDIGRYFSYVDTRIGTQKRVLERINEELERKQEEYMEAYREREVVVKLKEMAIKRYNKTLDKEEEKVIDDIVNAKKNMGL